MPHCHVHHLSLTLPQPITADDLPQLVLDLFDIQGLDPAAVRLPRGRHGYREAYSLSGPRGDALIDILVGGVARNVKGTLHFDIHGAAFEAGLDVVHVCREIINRHGWVTRIDLAADDIDGVLPWPEIVECCHADQWEERITTTTCRPRLDRKTGTMEPCPPVYLREVGETIYYGRQDSDLSICMYTRRGPVRAETRIRNRAAATDAARRIAGGEDLTAITTGVLSRNLKFHVAGLKRKDRRPVCEWWDAFLGSAPAIKLPRQRDHGHRNPWYVPPTRADKVRKTVQRHLAGANPEATIQVLDTLRALIADHDLDAAIEEFGNRPL